jgi:hypothetical protein
LLHGLRHALRAAAQGLERAPLRIDRTVGIAVAELALGVAHGLAGAAELIHALTTLLTFALLLAEPALAQLFEQFLQLLAQCLLVLSQFAHILLALTALPLAALILPLTERTIS